MPVFFSFERPNRFRLEMNMGSKWFASLFCNGTELVTYVESLNKYTQKDAPEFLTPSVMRWAGGNGMVIQNILMSDNPLREMTKGLEDIKEIGIEELDGSSVSVFEMKRLTGSLPFFRFLSGTGKNMSIKMRLWIGNRDFLIRKVFFTADMDRLSKGMPENQRERMKELTWHITRKHRAVKINPFFTDKVFTFTPPDKAELVQKLR